MFTEASMFIYNFFPALKTAEVLPCDISFLSFVKGFVPW